MKTKLIITEAQLKTLKENLIKECWESHKQIGMKEKGGKQVPNCVPKNESVNEYGSDGEFDDAELQGQEDFYDQMNQNSKESESEEDEK
jgi:hypothetical protein